MAKGSRNHPVEGTVEGFLEDAMSTVEELRDEMSEWRDNIEEGFSHTEKYERVSEAADALEVEAPEAPSSAEEVKCNTTIDTRRSAGSRTARLANALNLLYAARDAAENHKGLLESEQSEEQGGENDDLGDEIGDLETFLGEMDDLISQLEGVEFPGMFG